MKMPFDWYLFCYAVVGLLGRAPDNRIGFGGLGLDGFYYIYYCPRDDNEISHFKKNAKIIAGWLDKFDFQFPGSQCEYGRHRPSQPGDKDELQIRISGSKEDMSFAESILLAMKNG